METMSNIDPDPSDVVKELPIACIYWTEPTDITEQQIKNMALSLLVHTQIEPIVVTARDEKGYRGVIGRLRYEGMRHRWRGEPEGKTILARIHEFKDAVEVKMWQLAENLHRREVTPMFKAQQYQALFALLTEKHETVACLNTLAAAIEDATGNPESVKTIQHYLSLTKLQPKTQEILTGEKLPLRAGLELLRIKDPKQQVKAAEAVQKMPEKTVEQIKYKVDEYVVNQKWDKQRDRLNRKAEELRAKGKIVVLEAPYGNLSYSARQQLHEFYGEVSEDCKQCSKLGVLLSGNFQQKPLCTDAKCYEGKQAERNRKAVHERKEITQQFEVERAKILSMPPDVRFWRMTVFALIDHYPDLQNLLQLKDSNYVSRDDALWLAINKLDEKECQQLLIRNAVEHILAGPEQWRNDSLVKKWAVREFGLTPKVFLKVPLDEAVGVSTPIQVEKALPCTSCSNDKEQGGKCGREHFHVDGQGDYVCEQKVPKKT